MILLVHLSDIHLKDTTNSIDAKKSCIIDTYKNRLHGVDKVFFLFSGDIAFSGSSQEYLNAIELIGYIKDETDKLTQTKSSVICVPGNHDCIIIKSEEAARNLLIDAVNAENVGEVDNSIIEICSNCQKGYREFVETVHDQEAVLHDDRLLTIYKYNVNGNTIQFNCLNTSWMSKQHENQGKLGFPIKNYSESLFTNGANLSVSLLHHPRVWQNAINSKEIDDFLNTYSGIIITGHEHNKDRYAKTDLTGKYTEYIEGGVLQDSDNPHSSDFNVILLDLDQKNQEIMHFSYKSGMYECKSNLPVPLKDMNGIIIDSVILTEEMNQFISDPGINLQSRYRDEIFLSDIFIFPDLISLKINKVNLKKEKIYSSESLLNIDGEQYKVLLQGGEKLGKTTFCKVAYRFFLKNMKVPILISGVNLNIFSEDDLLKRIAKYYTQQYKDKSNEDFYQLDFKNVFLIIDDFDEVKLNTKFKGQLLAKISSTFDNVLITVGDLFKIEEIVYDKDKKHIVLDQYKQHKLLSFGNVLRAELINKWNLLGRESELEDDQLIKLNENACRVINAVIGKNLVPSYPIFILTLLQTIEAGTPHDLKTSSQGYYYNYLITQALGQLKLKNDKINFYYNFLSVLAYKMFENNIKDLDEGALKIFYDETKDLYVVTEEYGTLVANLLKAKMLDIRGGNYCFKYKYEYYFFTAKHLADSIGQDKVKNYIKKMSHRAYNEEFANILMFLTHHSKDPFILDSILLSAKNIFNDYDPIKLETDVNILNKLTEEIPKMVLQDSTVHETRRKKLVNRDEVDNIPELDAKQHEYGTCDINESIDDLDLVRKLNLAFKTIEILGQLVKSYHGAILKTKTIDLAVETYLIALRALKSFFSFVENNLDAIVNEIKSEIAIKHLEEKNEIEKFSKDMLFFICTLVSYGFIKKVSNSIGAENLDEVYQRVYDLHPINSVDMINTSITMDFAFEFPINKINKIKSNHGHHHLVSNILRRMAIEYIYMFPTDYSQKQKICSSLDISMDTQRILDATSTQKKLL